ncbi:membrane protein insertase YidC [soil metagenome]
MEKRVLIAVFMMSIVILVSNLLFPPEPPPQQPAQPQATPAPAARVQAPVLPQTAPGVPADTIVVRTPLAHYVFSTRGAVLQQVTLPAYESHVQRGKPVQLVPAGGTLLANQLVVGGSSQNLGSLPFQASARTLELKQGEGPHELRFTYGGNGAGAEIVYTFRPDRYTVGVRGRMAGLGGPGAILVTDLGTGLANHEANPKQTRREMAVVAGGDGGVDNIGLDGVKTTRTLADLAWVGIKGKYFLAALVAPGSSTFQQATARNVPDIRQVVRGDTVVIPRASLTVQTALAPDGGWTYEAYLGPQQPKQLVAAGRGLEEVNPYGYRWRRPVVRPTAASILWTLAALHDNLGLGYGMVLVVFGILVKIVTWPLNAKAMRAQMKNMEFQPLMQEIQTKYKSDPQRQQQEMMKLYREKGFNPLSGCMPLLIPMPVFITLFFVLQTAIEFRGVSFMWLPDLALPDPLYILPILFMVSTFALQWISMTLSGMEQNPQMQMMMYVMPLVFGIFFFTVASGLNLYYLASNVAGLPQQILIARERRRANDEMKKNAPKTSAATPAPAATRAVKRPAQRAKRRR